jgi:DNA polymerase
VTTIDHCAGCPYLNGGPAIGPSGDPVSRIVLVGEAPGRDEIKNGEPFIGPAGQLLRADLKEAGIRIDEVFITNSVACRPNPVKPKVRAIEACHDRLVRDVGAHQRAVIVALGGTAARALTGRRDIKPMRDRGTVIDSMWGPILPTLHPARVLRVKSERPLRVVDLMTARQMVEDETP